MLKINNLSFSYDVEHPVFQGLSFDSSSMKIGIIGNNGTGKSTLLKLLTGELIPQSGSITSNGRLYRTVYHLTYYEKLSILDLLKLIEGMESFDLSNVDYLTEGLSLTNFLNHRISELSQGTYKKIGILFTFLSTADILLLDEPFESIDDKSIQFVKTFLMDTSKAIILVDHHLNLVNEICDECLDLNEAV